MKRAKKPTVAELLKRVEVLEEANRSLAYRLALLEAKAAKPWEWGHTVPGVQPNPYTPPFPFQPTICGQPVVVPSAAAAIH